MVHSTALRCKKNNIWARACGGLVRTFPQFYLFHSFLTVFPILLQVRNNPLKTTLQVILSKKTQTSLGNLPVLFLKGIFPKNVTFCRGGGPYGTAEPSLKKHLKSFLENFLLCTGAKVCRIDIFVIFG